MQVEAPALDLLQLLHEVERVHHDAVADDAVLAVVEDAAGDEVEDVLLAAHDDGVTGIGSALEARYDISLLGKEVYDLALAFIAPLGADQYGIHVSSVLR